MNEVKIIKLDNIHVRFGRMEALAGVSLIVARGDFLALAGPNGSGKTTLLKVALGLVKPASGDAYLFGQRTDEFKDWHRVGYLSQQATRVDNNFPITVFEAVSLGRLGRSGSGRLLNLQDRQSVEHALEIVGLQDFRGRRISQLSGGQQQRVFLGRALARNPELLILDEPTAGLDLDAQKDLFALLSQLNCNQDLTIVMVTHEPSIVSTWVKEVAWLNRKVLFRGLPGELFQQNYWTLQGYSLPSELSGPV
ncbi:MAG: metal ABC transporter ATP-binding protein [Bacillota bacterium]